MTKSELRKIAFEQREQVKNDESIEKCAKIYQMLFDQMILKSPGVLHIFLPIKKFNEINTKPIIDKLWRDLPQITTVVPRVNFDANELEHLKLTNETKLVESDWGILEPEGSEFVEIEKIDLVLVPLLAFDLRGFRVGYGKGFYDKFLSLCRPDCLKVGLSFFPPVDEISDVNEFDVALDHCITPERVFSF